MKQNIPAKLKGAYSYIVLFKYFVSQQRHNWRPEKTDNLRALKFLQRSVLPIMMNWESGVNDASSVTALLLLYPYGTKRENMW